jgi:hypothetical protein
MAPFKYDCRLNLFRRTTVAFLVVRFGVVFHDPSRKGLPIVLTSDKTLGSFSTHITILFLIVCITHIYIHESGCRSHEPATTGRTNSLVTDGAHIISLGLTYPSQATLQQNVSISQTVTVQAASSQPVSAIADPAEKYRPVNIATKKINIFLIVNFPFHVFFLFSSFTFAILENLFFTHKHHHLSF